MSQIRFAPCPGCLALSQDQRYAAYLARVLPHCGYQYQAPRCASGVWTSHWLPLVSSSRHWLSNGFPMLILIQLLSNGYPMVYQCSNGCPMASHWIYLNIHGFPIGCIICFPLPGSPLSVGTTSPSWRQSLGWKDSLH